MDSRGIDICTCTHDRSQHAFIRTVADPVGGEVCLGPDCTCQHFFPHPQPNNVKFVPAAPGPRLRVGRKVGRTIYDANDQLIGVMDTPELAAMVVAAVNRSAE